jgi:hypothetical protein
VGPRMDQWRKDLIVGRVTWVLPDRQRDSESTDTRIASGAPWITPLGSSGFVPVVEMIAGRDKPEVPYRRFSQTWAWYIHVML